MIHSIADLLKEFVSAEVELLNSQNINHPTTIGSMFEGLTEEIFNKSILKGLNLKIVKNSFIVGCENEFDIMLVEGEGEKIPYTDRYKYSPQKVIAIVQAKKNLYSKDLKDSHDNLKKLVDYFRNNKIEDYTYRMFDDSFRITCRKNLSALDRGELSLEEEYIYNTLKLEALLPIRIIWGYNGFKSESNFRESFHNHIYENITKDFDNKISYFGAHNFANLIICDKYSIIKQNGMPFTMPLVKGFWWPFLATTSYNPTYFFLEVIWTRLSYRYNLSSDIFGEDLSLEPGNRFIDCRITKVGSHHGWEYKYFEVKDSKLKENKKVKEWSPIELDEKQFLVVTELCSKGEIVLDNKFESFILDSDYNTLNDFLAKIINTGLVTIENGKLFLLTDQCQCIILPDGRYFADENKSGRLTNWILNMIKSKTTQ